MLRQNCRFRAALPMDQTFPFSPLPITFSWAAFGPPFKSSASSGPSTFIFEECRESSDALVDVENTGVFIAFRGVFLCEKIIRLSFADHRSQFSYDHRPLMNFDPTRVAISFWLLCNLKHQHDNTSEATYFGLLVPFSINPQYLFWRWKPRPRTGWMRHLTIQQFLSHEIFFSRKRCDLSFIRSTK